MRRLLRYGGVFAVEVFDDRTLYVLARDVRSYTVETRRGTQADKVAIWRTLAERKPDLCVDVGANYGEFAVCIADLGLPVLCVEPNPAIVECLRRSFESDKNVRIVEVAASDEDGRAAFYFDKQYSGTGSFGGDWPGRVRKDLFGRYGASARIQVATRRLDSLVPEVYETRPRSLIAKIDVEGFEELILRGMQGLIEQASWWRVLLEYNLECIRSHGKEPGVLWSLLTPHPGLIVPKEGTDPLRLAPGTRLPLQPPERSCEVLIGNGFGH